MKCQDMFSLKEKKKSEFLLSAVVIGNFKALQICTSQPDIFLKENTFVAFHLNCLIACL